MPHLSTLTTLLLLLALPSTKKVVIASCREHLQTCDERESVVDQVNCLGQVAASLSIGVYQRNTAILLPQRQTNRYADRTDI